MTNIGTLDFKRDRWGRPLIAVPGEDKAQPYTRISGFGTVLENQFGLNKWKMRTMLRGCLDRPDLRAMAESRIDDDRYLDDIVEKLIEHGGGSKAANLGTAIHEVLSQWNKGLTTDAEVPREFREHVSAWQNAVNAHGFTVLGDLVETHLVNDEFRAAGSGDVFLARPDGRVVACDIKTGKEIANRPLAYMVQLYLYATAQRYDVMTNTRTPLGEVDTDVAIIAHIPAGNPSCTFYEVDLREARNLTILASQVRKAEKEGAKVRPTAVQGAAATVERDPAFPPLGGAAPVANRIEWLRGRLRNILATSDVSPRVVAAWPDGVPFLKESTHSDAQCDAISKVLDRFEAELGIPFGAPDPAKPTTGVRKSKADEDKVREVFPDAVIVDDDAELSDEAHNEIRRRHTGLELEEQAWIASLVKQASAAKVPLTLKTKKTVGRGERVKAMLDCVPFAEDADVVGTMLRTVTGHNQPIPNFGAAFGALTIDQARRLQRIANNLGNGTVNLVFSGEEVVALDGDIA